MARRLPIALALLASAVVLVALARDSARAPGPIATLDTLRLMERMLEMPEFADPRNAEIEQLQTPLLQMDSELRQLINQWQTMDQNTPQAGTIRMEAERLQQQLVQGQQNAQQRIDAFTAEQFAQAFVRVRGAADTIADQQGFAYVMTSRFEDDEILTQSTSLFVQEILYRSALVAPEGTDITDAVASMLNIPEQGAEGPAAIDPMADPMADPIAPSSNP